ncbi:unnamed protein product [Ectocarpus sp. CCAP 1310/34]|nr:unnamed protein product [Ectocarpus sp. CCAP 1310/34]
MTFDLRRSTTWFWPTPGPRKSSSRVDFNPPTSAQGRRQNWLCAQERFGWAVQRTKALQIQVAQRQPRKNADINGIVEEYGLPFDIQPLQEDPTAIVRRTHALRSNAGPYYGPDTLHDCNHGDDSRQKYGGIDSCAQLSGVNLNAYEQNHAKKKKFLRTLNVMKFDRFAFMVTLINETKNEAINRESVANTVKRVRGHGSERVEICQAEVWFWGRCFCQESLVRSFDQFSRVRPTFLFIHSHTFWRGRMLLYDVSDACGTVFASADPLAPFRHFALVAAVGRVLLFFLVFGLMGCRWLVVGICSCAFWGDRYTWFFVWGIHGFRYTIGLL